MVNQDKDSRDLASSGEISETSVADSSSWREGFRRFLKYSGCFYLLLICHVVADNVIFHQELNWSGVAGMLLMTGPGIVYVFYYLPFHICIQIRKSAALYFKTSLIWTLIWWLPLHCRPQSPDYIRRNSFGPTYIDGEITLNGLLDSLFSFPIFVTIFSLVLLIHERRSRKIKGVGLN